MPHSAREPDTAVVRVEKMAAGGDGIARLADGRVVFVEGGLAGESVQVSVHTSKKDFARATVVAVLEPSAHRVVPPCPEVARGCGGCGWQHATAEGQLAWKVDIVADALRRTAKLPDAVVRPGGGVGPWGYRTGMRLAVDRNGRVGLRAAGSHRVVALGECPVAAPALSALLADVRVHGADEVSLRVGVSSGEATALAHGDRARIERLPDHVAIGPAAVLHETVAGRSLQVSAASFFQSGPQAAELLVAVVREVCGDALSGMSGPLLDAYGGGGLFSAGLGVPQAILVESSTSACADARVNVPSAEVVESLFERWAPRPVDLVVADPARAGLGREAVDVVAATGADCVVLVSCDPVSLARDSALLAAHGFRHEGSTVLDLFPHTPHIEVVTRFTR
ncbi:MAG: TRAM domain-containing protein [Actinomycetota bacterium]|nr:TRAM domain-containing protein [Actinomycetota bacterium]